jgi:hypothetical protein
MMQEYFREDAEVFRNVFETPHSQHEHDIVVLTENSVLIIECKGGTFRRPLIDADKAYERLRSDVQSSDGLQGAYDQGLRLFNRIKDEDTVRLYDKNGNPIKDIRADAASNIYILIVTLTEWGPVASDLGLLSKNVADPWPWIICVAHLESFLEGLRMRFITTSSFTRFLGERSALGGLVFTADESETCAIFLCKLTLTYFNVYNLVAIYPDGRWTEIFAAVWHSKNTGAGVDWDIEYPVWLAYRDDSAE